MSAASIIMSSIICIIKKILKTPSYTSTKVSTINMAVNFYFEIVIIKVSTNVISSASTH
jgi:hypothetical protein